MADERSNATPELFSEAHLITVQWFTTEWAGEVAALLREMEVFYGTCIADETNVEEDVRRHAAEGMNILLAFNGGRVVGFAFFSLLYPAAGLVSLLHLKQLYVANAARRLGVGRALLAHIARSAQERGCGRIEWTTGADNRGARALYEGVGAIGSDKVKYVLQGDALATLAQA